jgi:hypothetical protein
LIKAFTRNLETKQLLTLAACLLFKQRIIMRKKSVKSSVKWHLGKLNSILPSLFVAALSIKNIFDLTHRHK